MSDVSAAVFSIVFWFRNVWVNICWRIASNTISSIFLQVKKKCHCTKQGLKILRIYICKNSTLKMSNGIRKVRLRVKILDSCKFITDTVLQNTASSTAIFSLQPAEYKPVSWCTPYQDSTFYVSIFLVSGKIWEEGREREPPPSLHYYYLLIQVEGVLPYYSSQGSVQPQETGESCKRTWLFRAPLMLTQRTRFNQKN